MSRSLSASSSASQTQTPRKAKLARVQSSPAASEHDTNYFYESDSDGDERFETQFWAVRGLDTIFSGEEEAFDALRQNMGRLKYMQLLSSTSLEKLERFKRH
ncbi:hypothetical protein C8F04DRAFT_1193593 [Mycena alexandri]|uniref:Uncharacterized protein n=1 Tax=Mycena alexandri TaxID=1745969 RepID=A0AAD6S9W1_9AGAR|nr:hypothetical protein C8F04DRAFT_1193593 [Mycena alexandri]